MELKTTYELMMEERMENEKFYGEKIKKNLEILEAKRVQNEKLKE